MQKLLFIQMHHKLVYIAIVLGVILVYILIIFVGFQHFIALVVEFMHFTR